VFPMTDTRVTPWSVTSLTVCRTRSILGPSRSNFGTNHGVALAHVGQQFRKTRAVIASAGHYVGEHFGNTSGHARYRQLPCGRADRLRVSVRPDPHCSYSLPLVGDGMSLQIPATGPHTKPPAVMA
jgi:hypothetical protein